MKLLELGFGPLPLGQALPDGLGSDLQARDAHKIGDEERLIFERIGQEQPKHDILSSFFAPPSRQLGAGLELQTLAAGFNARQMREQNPPGIIQIVHHRINGVGPVAGGAKFGQVDLAALQALENGWHGPGPGLEVQRAGPKLLVRICLAGAHGLEGHSPGDEVNNSPVSSTFVTFGTRCFGVLDHRAGGDVVVVPWTSLLAGSVLEEPGLDEGRRGEVLVVGNRFGNKSLEIELFAAGLQATPIGVPGPAAAPVFFTIEEGDDRDGPGQQDQNAPKAVPTEKPVEESARPPEDKYIGQHIALPNAFGRVVHIKRRR